MDWNITWILLHSRRRAALQFMTDALNPIREEPSSSVLTGKLQNARNRRLLRHTLASDANNVLFACGFTFTRLQVNGVVSTWREKGRPPDAPTWTRIPCCATNPSLWLASDWVVERISQRMACSIWQCAHSCGRVPC